MTSSREEQAQWEAGRTDVKPALAATLVVLFLATVLSVPIIESLTLVSTGDSAVASVIGALEIPGRGWRAAVSADGGVPERLLAANRAMLRSMSKVDDEITERSQVGRWVRPALQRALFAVGCGTEQVLVGQEGWLFYRPAVDHIAGSSFLDEDVLARRSRSGTSWSGPIHPDPLPAIVGFRDQLAERGVELLLVPVPAKATIHPEKLSARLVDELTAPLHNPSFAELKALLDDAGVRIYDPAPLLVEHARDVGPAYLAADTHWRPEAMDRVAEAIADRVLGGRPSASGSVAGSVTVTHTGDLAAMLQVPESAAVVAPEQVTLNPAGELSSTSGVLLLGDSFANIYSDPGLGWGAHAGLAERLSAHLHAPVTPLLRNDDGAFATRFELARELASGRGALDGIHTVVWEFAARELSVGDWRPVDLPEATVEGGFVMPTANSSMVVQGRVVALGQPPDPVGAPYPDYLLALHLAGVTGPDIEGEAEALVFVWAMQDRKLLPAAHLETGDEVSLVLHPWSDVSSELGSISRGEIFSQSLLFEEPCWGEKVRVLTPHRLAPSATLAGDAPEASERPLPATDDPFRAAATELLATPVKGTDRLHIGRDGWIYHRSELRYAAAERFWGEAATTANPTVPEALADPTPAIVGFHEQLAARGVELVVIPVPIRPAIYPEGLIDLEAGSTGGTDGPVPIRDSMPFQSRFLQHLSDLGVTVVDLTPGFLRARQHEKGPLFTRSDTHWTPVGSHLAARTVAKTLARREWMASVPRLQLSRTWSAEDRTGRLSRMLTDAGFVDLVPESVPMHKIKVRAGKKLNRIELRQPDSPVVLLGDSNTFWWKRWNSSFAHQLAGELGFAVDVLSTEGGGANETRLNLRRTLRAEPSFLEGRKVVIWCFTSRSFVTTQEGWLEIPL